MRGRAAVADPREREKPFGQRDPDRSYGPDYRDRLSEAGFSVTVDGFGDAAIQRQGLTPHENVYFCAEDFENT